MAGGLAIASPTGNVYEGRVTAYVIIAAVVAASGGLLFGYDIGVTGGVTTQPAFLATFFPSVLAAQPSTTATAPGQPSAPQGWCKYNSQMLQLFTSSLFLSGIGGAAMASSTTSALGRVATMRIAGVFFLIGAAMTAGAGTVTVLVFGRLSLGLGVGLANQAVPLYLSEIAPAQWRGALNLMFQLATTIGILAGNLVCYWAQSLPPWGWRLALGLAGVPALLLTGGSLFLPETPSSLVERGRLSEGKAVLHKLRGKEFNINDEYEDILKACNRASNMASFSTIFDRKYRSELFWASILPFFQQMTGINAVMFYGPPLFVTLGFGQDASLYSACVIGTINVMATVVSVATVDHYGRKILFLVGGVVMFLMQLVIAIVLATSAPDSTGVFPPAVAAGLVSAISIFVVGFAVSWGPLAWLVPSEIQPLETRSSGQAITVAINFFSTFVVAQSFLTMLCAMRWGIFLFFAAWLALMIVVVQLYLPETKGIPIEDMAYVWGPVSTDEGATAIVTGPTSSE